MCLAVEIGAKQSSEVALIENCSEICWACLPAELTTAANQRMSTLSSDPISPKLTICRQPEQ
jgi:hypothetical protein